MTNDSLAKVLTDVATDIEFPRDCHECILSPHFLTTPGYRCPTCARHLVRAALLRQLAEKAEAYVEADRAFDAATGEENALLSSANDALYHTSQALLAFIRTPSPAPAPDEKR